MPNIKGKNILVSGGAGFIGSHLIDHFLAKEAGKIIVVDNLFLGNKKNLERFKSKNIVFYRLNVCEFKKLELIFKKYDVHIVYNLAVVPFPASLEKPKWTVMQNIEMTTNFCELLRLGMYQTLIHFSSAQVYGIPVKVPMDETHPLGPLTPYTASKAACDHLILSYMHTFGLDVAILRPSNNYGPRQNDQNFSAFIPRLTRRILEGKPIEIFGDGLQTRDFLFVKDTVEAAERLYESGSRGTIINVGSGQEITILETVRTILRLLNKPDYPVVHLPLRTGDALRQRTDITRAKEILGFSPRFTFEQGLKETLEWYFRKKRI